MNVLTQLLHLAGSGATAYITAFNLRNLETRPNMLAGLQLAESGSVPFLEALHDRAEAEGDSWLAEKLMLHANDERRHGQIFAHALKQLNKQAIDLTNLPKTKPDGTPDERRRSPFFDAYFEGYSQEQLNPQNIDWAVFFASTYILELDASQDFLRMARALRDDPLSANLCKGLESIAQDEHRHASYLREAMERRFSYSEVNRQIDKWRTCKVNAMLAMVTNIVQRNGKIASLVTEGAPVELENADLPKEMATAR